MLGAKKYKVFPFPAADFCIPLLLGPFSYFSFSRKKYRISPLLMAIEYFPFPVAHSIFLIPQKSLFFLPPKLLFSFCFALTPSYNLNRIFYVIANLLVKRAKNNRFLFSLWYLCDRQFCKTLTPPPLNIKLIRRIALVHLNSWPKKSYCLIDLFAILFVSNYCDE